MEIRGVTSEDINQINQIEMQHPFGLSKDYFCEKLAVEKEKIIAIGQLLPMAELLLMENFSLPERDRVIALRRLMIDAMFEANRNHFKQLHAFVRDEKFAALLKKHWNFTPCTGEALVLNL